MLSAVAISKVTPPAGAALDRVTVKVKAVVPEFPSAAVTSEMLRVGVNVCPVFIAPLVFAAGACHVKSLYTDPVPASRRERPAVVVVLLSATPISIAVMPVAAPLVAVNAPS